MSVPPSVGVVVLSSLSRHLDLIKRSLPNAPNHSLATEFFLLLVLYRGVGRGDLTAVTTPETSHLSPPSTVAREREPSASPSALAARSRTAPVSIIVGYGAGKKSRLNL